MQLVADIEGNGLYNDITEIHCIVCRDKETKKNYVFYDAEGMETPKNGSIADGVAMLASAELVIGHNWIDYDIRVIKKFFPETTINVDKIRDTYIRSLMFNPHRSKHPNCPVSKMTIDGRRQIGPHGLENWGYIVGRGKVENEDWTKLTDHMIKRCVEDVAITDLVDDYLAREEGDWDWALSEWIEKSFRLVMSEQEGHGWLFDKDGAERLVFDLECQIDDIDEEVMPRIPLVIGYDEKVVTQIRKKDGGYYANFIKWFENSGIGDVFTMSDFKGDFCRVSFEEINLASDKQVKEYLLSVGWEPTEWNYKKDGKRFVKDEEGQNIKTSPKLTEDSFESLSDDSGKLIARRVTLCHRRSQIQGWINSVRPDGRIGAGGNSCGTNTARVAHRGVVNVPKAEEGVFLGKEMRALFTAPEGYTLVGGDLSALEDRLAGHHTFKYDGGSYAKDLLEADVHQKTADLFGVSRFKGKTLNHALKYGAQWPKVAEITGCTPPRAKYMWGQWWEAHPSLSKLKGALEYALEKRGFKAKGKLSSTAFVKGMDGRKIFLRSAHSILNARIQNAGSIVHKLVTIYTYEGIQEAGIDAHIVGNFHDEVQSEVRNDHVDQYKAIVKQAEAKVNKLFDFKVPMELEAKEGRNWKETH